MFNLIKLKKIINLPRLAHNDFYGIRNIIIILCSLCYYDFVDSVALSQSKNFNHFRYI